ncbi:hypothetical protein MLD38_001156 [Melastoma candidum]|uniref:Uncharacterized protein n=1 Tax=Melastoma candidum TaxID=119954 RepID=A0ACB9SDA8_9MYRT|nr:hypothetical protein MLD38_001156 [Melastoma candidum]
MGGIGKTTIARFVYERIWGGFDGCSFLANIREMMVKKGILSLQERLLRDVLKDERIYVPDVNRGVEMIRYCLKSLKVLIVLDDVDDGDQLEALAGNNHWFGPGSRVIVTTRDVHLLEERGGDRFFFPEKLDDDEALRLFSLRAFKEDDPPEPYMELSRSFVEYSCGLPLALTVLGSFLYARGINEWRSMLNKLQKAPLGKITDVLKVSFDGLDDPEKEMFLDIACFFNGEYDDRVIRILDACELDPQIGLRVLHDKCLIRYERGKLRMHDLLMQMGKEIVRKESPKEPGRRSRLWRLEDAQDVLENNEGSGLVEGIYLPESSNKSAKRAATSIDVHPEAFKKMRRLRFLKLWNGNIPNGLHYLPDELRYFEWHNYPSSSLPLDFHPRNLVELRLPYSNISTLNFGPKPLKNLTHLDLSHSTWLIQCPDFSLIPNLEEIILTGCVRLSFTNQSIRVLKRLHVLELSGCKTLLRYPQLSAARKMPRLSYFFPLKLSVWMNVEKNDEKADWSKEEEKKAEKDDDELDLRSSSEWVDDAELDMLCSSERLGEIWMDEEKNDEKADWSKEEEKKAEKVDGTERLPFRIEQLSLTRTDKIRMNEEKKDEKADWLKKLKEEKKDEKAAGLKNPGDSSFPEQKRHMGRTRPPSAKNNPRGTGVRWLEMLSNFHLLRNLDLSNCDLPDYETIVDLSCLSSLQNLDLKYNRFTRVPFDISGLHGLISLWLSYCENLEVLPELPRNVQMVAANHCNELRALPDHTGLDCSEQCDISVINCPKLVSGGADGLIKSILQKLLQIVLKETDRGRTFNFYLPGAEVPSIGSDGVEDSSSTSFVTLKSYGAIQSEHLWVSYLFRRQWASHNVDPGGILHRVTVRFHSFDPDTKRMSASTSAGSDGGGTGSSGLRDYDVFLSFSGEDTRLNFTDHLYSALVQRGITTFRDDEALERGAPIKDRLFSAIEHSRFCLVVFSKNYASSSWCLDELAKIYSCMSKGRTTILPIFFDVDPSHVRKQTGCFEAAFAVHGEVYGKDSTTLLNWRKALEEVANLTGWDLRGKHQSVVVKEIVMEIFANVNSELPFDQGSLVGMGRRAGKLLNKLDRNSDDPYIVGIPGMGGLGKSTLARVVYESIRGEFDGCSFLANVRETTEKRGLVSLQEQLLRDVLKDDKISLRDINRGINMMRNSFKSSRVLLVLDDVDERDQLEALAGNCHWFGPGSRVLVTTRDVHLLEEWGVDELFYPEKLDEDEAFRLFSLRAFKEVCPPEPFLELSRDFVEYTCGLPLAVTVLGSFLFARNIDEWKSTLNRLKTTPDDTITKVLKISFAGLNRLEKEIFLDIACIFNGEGEDRVIKILEACGFDPHIGLRVLRDKFMMNTRELRMHDLLQPIGKEIVHLESPKEPGRRSRLWSLEEVRYVLENNAGSGLVEGIYLTAAANRSAEEVERIEVDPKAFKKMTNLRILKLRNADLSKGLQYLPNTLRYLEWHNYSLRSLPSSFQPKNLVELSFVLLTVVSLPFINEQPLENLTCLDLSYSTSLVESPDFILFPKLEAVSLAGCVGLSEIHESIGTLVRLFVLNLSGCKNLVRIPNSISGVKSLKRLDLCGCSKLTELPEGMCRQQCLEDLNLGDTSIQELPSSFGQLNKLRDFSFSGCQGQPSRTRCPFSACFSGNRSHPCGTGAPLCFPSNFCFLQYLNLSYCEMPDHEPPINLSCLSALQELDLRGNIFTRVPFDIGALDRLHNLQLSYCERLEVLPKLPGNVQTVAANHCTALRELPVDIGLGSSEKCDFSFIECHKLVNMNGGADGLLKSILQKLLMIIFQDPDRERTFNFYLPGSEVPRWFICRSTGATTTLKLDADWFDDSFKGFVVCAAFFSCNCEDNSVYWYKFNYSVRVDGMEESPSTSFVMSKSHGAIWSRHLWASYVFRRQWARYNGDPEAEGISHRVKVRFHSYDTGAKVIGCGIHPVYSNQTEGNGFLGSMRTSSSLDNSSIESPDVSSYPKRKRCCNSFSDAADGAGSMAYGDYEEGLNPQKIHVRSCPFSTLS